MTQPRKPENPRPRRHPLRQTHVSPLLRKQEKERKRMEKGPTLEEARAIPLPPLTGAERTRLRGEAHHLEPVVIVGQNGVTDAVIEAIHAALCRHELIKVRMHEPDDKHALAEEIAQRAHAVLLGLRGHTLILWRPRTAPTSGKSAPGGKQNGQTLATLTSTAERQWRE